MLIETLGPTAIPTIVCFVLGLLFLIIEMFTPGVGVPCVLGLMCLVAVVVMQLGWGSPSVALYIIAIALLIIILGIILIIRSLQRGRLSHSFLVLDESIAGDSTDLGSDRAAGLVGSTGIAVTALRPAGIAEIDGKRLDVMTTGAFVQKGRSLRVTNVEGLHILVEEIEPQEPAADSPEA